MMIKKFTINPLKKLAFNILKKRREIFPKILSIEFTSACNAKCIMCPQPNMDRKKEMGQFSVQGRVFVSYIIEGSMTS